MQRRLRLASALTWTVLGISTWQPSEGWGQERSILVNRRIVPAEPQPQQDAASFEVTVPFTAPGLASDSDSPETQMAGLSETFDESVPPAPGTTFDTSPIGTGVRDNRPSVARRRHLGDRPNARPDLLDPQRARPLPGSESETPAAVALESTATESVAFSAPAQETTPITSMTEASETVAGEESFSLAMAMISLDARGPVEIAMGRTGSYVLRVENLGEEPLAGVVIDVELPAHLKLVSGNLPTAGTPNRFVVGQLEARGSSELLVEVEAVSRGTGTLSARARVAAEAKLDVSAVEPLLELQVFGPKRGEIGTPLTYRVRVRNQGDAAIDGVRLEPQLSTGLRSVSDDETAGLIGWLEPGAEREVLWQVVADRPGRIAIGFTAVGEGTQSVAEGMIQIGAADLQVQLVGPESAPVGVESVYEVVVTNPGPQARRNVTLVVQLPQGMRVTALDRQARHDTRSGKLTLPLGVLESGGAEALRFKAVPQRGGDRKLVATAQAQGASAAVAEHVVKIETRR